MNSGPGARLHSRRTVPRPSKGARVMARHALAVVADLDLERAFARHRPALTGYCYRMLRSTFEADDAVQETLVRAWRGRAGFEGRSSVRSWLYKIATNVC